MKVTPRFMIRAALVATAGGVIGAFGACKDSNAPAPPPPPPPPPPLAAPAAPTAAAVDSNKISLTWAYSDTTVTGFKLARCQGAGCTNFAQVGTNLARTARAYTDSALALHTAYMYRIQAVRGSDTSAWSPTATATTGSGGTGSGSSFTMVGAGEITNCATTASMATGNIIKGILAADTSAVAFTAGNNLTDSMPNTTYADCYAPKWGDFKDRTYFAVGNGDYLGGRGPTGVYAYLGNRTKGPDGKGWYSIDRGNWHIIFLNTGDWEQTTAQLQDPNGPMNAWLASDLSTVPATKCIMAVSWNRRIYTTSTGELGLQFNLKQAASLLYAAHADLLVSAYDHLYARFPQTNNNGVPAADGFRQFIVGTGGQSLYRAITPADDPNTTAPMSPVEVQEGNNTTPGNSNGVIKFRLNDNSYEWEFIPTLAGGFTDKSSAPVPCH
ncbi:MAG: hypothetical protein DMD62_06440 [Gemmatimonadetes bacterium]|nr:MAG: hypothetical protein DMD62_06440 [Gemmatimonadota bacterium]